MKLDRLKSTQSLTNSDLWLGWRERLKSASQFWLLALLLSPLFSQPALAQGGGGITGPCITGLVPDRASFNHNGGSGRFEVRLCGSWTASASSGWIRITSQTGRGNGSISYAVDRLDPVGVRTGHIDIRQNNNTLFRFAITQESRPRPCPGEIRVAPPSITAPSSYSEQVVVVTPNHSWCSWNATAKTGDGMIALRFRQPQTPYGTPFGQGSFVVEIPANMGSNARRGAVILRDYGEIPVFQEGRCSYTVKVSKTEFPSEGGSASISVETNKTDCAWAVERIPSWITISSGPTGTGNGVINFEVAANNDTTREAQLCVAGRCFQIKQFGSPDAFCREPIAPFNPRDIAFVVKSATGTGRTEFHALRGEDNYASYAQHHCTGLPETGDETSFALINWDGDKVPDLVVIKKYGTASGQTEVQILSSSSGYTQSLVSAVTPLGPTDQTWQFLVGDYNADGKPDLFAISKRGLGSGKTEVYVLSGASNFREFLLRNASAVAPTDNTHEFALGYWDGDNKPDLFLISKQGASGLTEARILSGASQYTEFIFQGVTGLHATDENFTFDVTDWDQDEIPDLLLVKKQFTGTGATEVHVLSGANRFKQFILHAGTALGHTDQRHQFFIAERPGFKPRRRSSADGDRFADLPVYRPQSGVWFVMPTRREMPIPYEASYTSPDGHPYFARQFGLPADYTRRIGQPDDIPVIADYDGDGLLDLAVWRPNEGNWYILPTTGHLPLRASKRYLTNDGLVYYAIQLGLPGDIPVPGYYDGDGAVDLSIWRPANGRWEVMPTTGRIPLKFETQFTSPDGHPCFVRFFGKRGDAPMPADYDGDKLADFALWRPGEGRWYVLPTTGSLHINGARATTGDGLALFNFQLGASGDIPFTGYFDGDDKADPGVFRPSQAKWEAILSANLTPAFNVAQPNPERNRIGVRYFGNERDMPVPADYDGDGMYDIAVWRPADGNWHILPTTGSLPLSTGNRYQTSDGKPIFVLQLGLRGDLPQAKHPGR